VIRITGSTIHGFGLHKSDLDILVAKRSGEVHRSSLKDRTAALDKKIQRFYNKIRKGKRLDLNGSTIGRTLEEPLWQRQAITRLMEIVFADSTDTIKPLIQLESLELDISFQQEATSYWCTNYMAYYGRQNPAVPAAARILRLWANSHGLINARVGLWNAISINFTLLAVMFHKGLLTEDMKLDRFQTEDRYILDELCRDQKVAAEHDSLDARNAFIETILRTYFKAMQDITFHRTIFKPSQPYIEKSMPEQPGWPVRVMDPFGTMNMSRCVKDKNVVAYIRKCLAHTQKNLDRERKWITPAMLKLNNDGTPMGLVNHPQDIRGGLC